MAAYTALRVSSKLKGLESDATVVGNVFCCRLDVQLQGMDVTRAREPECAAAVSLHLRLQMVTLAPPRSAYS